MPVEKSPAPIRYDLLPPPEAPPIVQPIHIDHNLAASGQLATAAAAKGRPGYDTLQWRAQNGDSFRVTDVAQEHRQVEVKRRDYGRYNTWTNKLQRDVLDNVLPNKFPELFRTGEQSLVHWKGKEVIDRKREAEPYRVVEHRGQDNEILELLTFRSEAEFAAYIDRHTPRHTQGGHGGGRGFHHLTEMPDPVPFRPHGFEDFGWGEPQPKDSPKKDLIPVPSLDGSLDLGIALAQSRRLGLQNQEDPSQGSLQGLTFVNAEGHKVTVKADAVTRVDDPGFNYLTYLKPAVILETSLPSEQPDADVRAQPARPGDTFKRQSIITVDELQSQLQATAKAHAENPSLPPINPYWELPSVAAGDEKAAALRKKEVEFLHRENHLTPATYRGLAHVAMRNTVEGPERMRSAPTITFAEAATLVSQPDKPGWEDRAKKLLNTPTPHLKDPAYIEAMQLRAAVEKVGIEAVGHTADDLLHRVRASMDKLGLSKAGESISISSIFVALAERHAEALPHPGVPRSDGLQSGNPFDYSPTGELVRQEIVDMAVGQAFKEAALQPVYGSWKGPDGVEYTVLTGYKLRQIHLLRALPANVHQAVLQFLEQEPADENVSLSGADLAALGRLLNANALGKKKDKDRYAFTVTPW